MTAKRTDLFLTGKRTRLTWHRQRRSMADPAFSAEVMADGGQAALSAIPYRQQPRPLILGEELAEMMPKAHPEALLQFDMKNDLAQVSQRGVPHLADHFAGRSGTEWRTFRSLMASGPDQTTTDASVATEAAWRAWMEDCDGMDG